MNAKKAWSIVKGHNPGMKVYSCIEGEKYYMFGLEPNDIAEGDIYFTAAAYLVNKNSGEYTVVPWTTAYNNENHMRIVDKTTFE